MIQNPTEKKFNEELARLKTLGEEGFEPFPVINGSIFKKFFKPDYSLVLRSLTTRKDKLIKDIEEFFKLDNAARSSPKARRVFRQSITKYRKNLLDFQEKVEEHNAVIDEVKENGVDGLRDVLYISPLNRVQLYRQRNIPVLVQELIETIYSEDVLRVINYQSLHTRIMGAKKEREQLIKNLKKLIDEQTSGIIKSKETKDYLEKLERAGKQNKELKTELVWVKVKLHQEKLKNRVLCYLLQKEAQKTDDRIKVKSDKNVKMVKKLWDLQQELFAETEKYTKEKSNHQTAQTNYHNTAIDLVKEKTQAKKAATALKNRALELKNDLINQQNQTQILQNKIQQAEQDLGVSLDNLSTELEGKTLAEYKQERERERDELSAQLIQVQTEANNYKNQLEKQKDYSEIKQERDQLKIELNQIIAQIIRELRLDLNQEASLEQVLDKIKKLITNKPDTNQETTLVDLRQKITEQEKEIKKLREQNKENYSPITKEQIKKHFKSLGISNSVYQSQLDQIVSSQELANFHQQVIKEEMGQIRKQKNNADQLNIVLAILFVSSLLATTFLSIKLKKRKLLGPTRGREK
ncbi:protein of unknown function [endosymbiont DhMRE of Dentiscutata heterogama]|uniref:hypothetical protein n=1 Tax=endosymbiont DhMRE of Dentiscutata heterogama TaxID=1609546 RepID=UPI000629DB87|nr:hypothetical protein [endosymbiont DhMRE of Dentiscutata heterogama]CFW92768.1 protein of unknown function [endosymbiont DhMRE of Dentiscutata heterogama]